MLEADVRAGFRAGLSDLPIALRSLRRRQLELCRRLSPDDWGRQSRCHLWAVHDVVRHVRDCCHIHVDGLRQGETRLDREGPFDPRETPLRWLRETAFASPSQTVAELSDLCTQEADALDARLASGRDDLMTAPYGPAHWTVLTAHVFWDAWLHDRDVAQPLGVDHTSSPVEDGMMALYSLLLASTPALRANHTFDVTVALTTDQGPGYLASVRPGHVVLATGDGEAEAMLRGELVAVADSLAGRGPELEAVLHGDDSVRLPLTWMRARMRPAS